MATVTPRPAAGGEGADLPMEFVTGKHYQNASGRFHVMAVGAATMKVAYTTGPQAGRVLIKQIVDMARLTTTEVAEQPLAEAPRKVRAARA